MGMLLCPHHGNAYPEELLAPSTAIWNNTAWLHCIYKSNHVQQNQQCHRTFIKAWISLLLLYIFWWFQALQIKPPHSNNETFYGCDTENWTTGNCVYSACCPVTSAVNMVKSSNARMNAKEINDLFGLEDAAYLGGGTTNITTDALKEPHVTSNNNVIEECSKSDAKSIKQSPFINWVRQHPLVFNDLFHWSNLAVMHTN